MRIVIDLQGAQTASRHRGIGRYSLALADAMLRQSRGHEFWIVTNADMQAPELGQLAALLPPERMICFHSVQPACWQDPANRWRRIASEQTRESFIRALQPDVVHVSSLVEGAQDYAVTSIGARQSSPFTAATLYDLIPLHDPAYLQAVWARMWYTDKMASLQRADLLLTISDYVKQDVEERLPVSPERVVNISSAAADIFRPIAVNDELRHRLRVDYGIHGDYLMCSGAMDPRKNLERLLAAYAILPESTRARYQLVITGHVTALENDRMMLVARRLTIASDRLVRVGQVSDSALVELYCAATLFVFPSLQEGFGLPVLEAMSCGTAVIGSGMSSIPEVIGRDDALFDPTNTTEMAAAIQHVIETPDFLRDLREYGLLRARAFSWASSASRALDAFELRADHAHMRFGWSAGLDQADAERERVIEALVDARAESGPVSDEDLVKAAAAMAANEDVLRAVLRHSEPLPSKPSWRIEGPFDSSYSLALVNREVARALDAQGLQVALHSTDGAGDSVPDARIFSADPAIARLHVAAASLPARKVDVSSRLLYPPRVADMDSRFNLLHAYAWEESELPTPWVEDFNEFLQGVSALSSHVRKVLIDSGVGLPTSVCGAGVDHWDRIADGEDFPIQARSFRFLHVSSGLPRKGVDVLLQAYGDAFTDEDDVSLVIKTFANPQQDVHRLLQDLKSAHPRFPDVVIIERDLSGSQLKSVYSQCQVMVAPSRAEGFGLPMAEAMIAGLAVITTAWGGQSDFCTPETAWLIDYEFAYARTLFDMPLSVWAEPSRAHLSALLCELAQMPADIRMRRVDSGRRLLRRNFNWHDVAFRLIKFSRDVHERPLDSCHPSVAWIGSLQSECQGVSDIEAWISQGSYRVMALTAEGGDDLVPVSADIRCCWKPNSTAAADELIAELDGLDATAVVVHYHQSLLPPGQLEKLLAYLHGSRSTTLLILENPSLIGEWPQHLLAQLRMCRRVIVADVCGMNMLKRHGVVDCAVILPRDAAEEKKAATGVRFWNMLSAIVWQEFIDRRDVSAEETAAVAQEQCCALVQHPVNQGSAPSAGFPVVERSST